jgi:REP element-mobilizing transposase RayT
MATYTQIFYHIVFSTKHRQSVLTKERRNDLFRYMYGIIQNHDCHLYRLNGVEDHLHIFTSIHPTVALSEFIKIVKVATHGWIDDNNIYQAFPGWQDGYSAFTHSNAEKDRLIEYIKGQEEHHKKLSFREEFWGLLEEAGIEFDEKYLV